jgi:hypothetical protein
MPPICLGRARGENGREQQQSARKGVSTPVERPSQQAVVNNP